MVATCRQVAANVNSDVLLCVKTLSDQTMPPDDSPETFYEEPSPASRMRVASGALFVACLLLPAYQVSYNLQTTYGWQAFLFGPAGLMAGHMSWIANPLFLFAWAKCANPASRTTALLLALIALGIAATFLFGKSIAVGSAGMYSYKADIGYFAWLLSIALTAVSAWTLDAPADDEASS